jgi:ABC-type Fe3+ transport system permease subunit
MARNVVRIALVLAVFVSESLLLFVTIVSAFAQADSGRTAPGWVGPGSLVLMLALLVAGLACVVGSSRSLKIAATVGVGLVGLGSALALEMYDFYQDDVSRGTFAIYQVLPAAVVLVGAGLMSRLRQSGEPSPSVG